MDWGRRMFPILLALLKGGAAAGAAGSAAGSAAGGLATSTVAKGAVAQAAAPAATQAVAGHGVMGALKGAAHAVQGVEHSNAFVNTQKFMHTPGGKALGQMGQGERPEAQQLSIPTPEQSQPGGGGDGMGGSDPMARRRYELLKGL